MIEMKVAGIALDAARRSPIILLRDEAERRAIPIYVSQEQARSIVSILENQTPPRPMTHDLMANILDAWEMDLDCIVIHALEDNTFFATLKLSLGDETRELDARPSDAIALALRLEAPIWVLEEVVADASIPVNQEADEAERQEFRAMLDRLSPQDLIERSGKGSSATLDDVQE
jgi:bifunctional DNase/RNase